MQPNMRCTYTSEPGHRGAFIYVYYFSLKVAMQEEWMRVAAVRILLL